MSKVNTTCTRTGRAVFFVGWPSYHSRWATSQRNRSARFGVISSRLCPMIQPQPLNASQQQPKVAPRSMRRLMAEL
jgi:hypothetical protein